MRPFLSHHDQITLSKCKIKLLENIKCNTLQLPWSALILENALIPKKKVSKLHGVVLKKPKDTQIPQVPNPPLWESGSSGYRALNVNR